MRVVIQAGLYFLLGYLLLIFHSTIFALLTIHPAIPNLLLPLVVFLGVSASISVPVGASVAFALGYLLDSMSGRPMGLYTFTLVTTYVLSKGAGLRLFLRGPLSEILLTFLVSILAGCVQLAMGAIFENPSPFPAKGALPFLYLMTASATTAVLSPAVFWLARVLERWRGYGSESRSAS